MIHDNDNDKFDVKVLCRYFRKFVTTPKKYSLKPLVNESNIYVYILYI